MKITIQRVRERLIIDPMDAVVPLGTLITWECSSDDFDQEEWRFVFAVSSPFGSVNTFRTRTSTKTITLPGGFAAQAQVAMLQAGVAMVRGEHKYDIHVRESDSGHTLAEEDPLIIVT